MLLNLWFGTFVPVGKLVNPLGLILRAAKSMPLALHAQGVASACTMDVTMNDQIANVKAKGIFMLIYKCL